MDDFGKMALRERQIMHIVRKQRFWLHFFVWAAISLFLFVIWVLTTRGFPWFLIPILAWGVFIVAHAVYAFLLRDPEDILIEREHNERGAETEKQK
jgi:hypothetical protein